MNIITGINAIPTFISLNAQPANKPRALPQNEANIIVNTYII